MKDGVYHNDWFDLDLPVPDHWSVETPPKADWFLDNFMSLLAAAAVERGDDSPLFQGSDGLRRAAAVLAAGKMDFTVTQDVHPVDASGWGFSAMSFRVRLPDGELPQTIEAAVFHGHIFLLEAASPRVEGLSRAEAALARIRIMRKP